ncbi:hypothetical protein KESI111651_02855 [Kerstersia similis]
MRSEEGLTSSGEGHSWMILARGSVNPGSNQPQERIQPAEDMVSAGWLPLQAQISGTEVVVTQQFWPCA